MVEDLIIVSTPYVPGYRITSTKGFTWGLIVRSRGLGGNVVAGLRTIFGGEIHEYSELLNQSRQQALERMKEHAREMGAKRRRQRGLRLVRARAVDDRGAGLRDGRGRREGGRAGEPGETILNIYGDR